jgi:phage shock protein A
MLIFNKIKRDMKREMKELEAKIKALRAKMEQWECFFQDDEVGIALAEVEEELDKFRFK